LSTSRSVAEADRLRNTSGGGSVPNLHARIDALRSRGDVVRGDLHELLGLSPRQDLTVEGEVYVALGYEAVEEGFRRNDDFLSSMPGSQAGLSHLGANILVMDEPEHRRYRALAQPAFAVKTMQSWEHRWLAPTLERLVGELPAQGRADLYGDYCAKFPVRTIAGSFGVPPADAEQFHLWVLQFTGGGTPAQAVEAVGAFDRYLTQVLEERRASPAGDVISLLASSEIVDDQGRHRLTDEEVLGFARLLILAGAGTTYRTCGFLLLQLACRPEVYAQLRADRALITAVIEETLRWSPPVTYFMRRVAADTELAGVEIPAGSFVQLAVGAANRDARRWDRPHEWDPDRALAPHVAFGFGPHFCIGNQLARMELRVAVERLLDRYEVFLCDPAEPAPEIDGLLFRFLPRLPVLLA
jgi:cytochrome P450